MFKYKIFPKNHNYRAYVFTLLLAFFCLYSIQNVSAQAVSAEFPSCYPGQKGGHNIEQCSNESGRQDIKLNCVQEQTKNHCINTIPVTTNNTAGARISENLCFRNWTERQRNHNGMDLAVGTKETVKAAADGIVMAFFAQGCSSTVAGQNGGGRVVKIMHFLPNFDVKPDDYDLPQGKFIKDPKKDSIVASPHQRCFITSYMHLSSLASGVAVGKPIKKDTPIGNPGGSGCLGPKFLEEAYAIHLHFEMTDCGGSPIDPMCPDLMDMCPKTGGSKGELGDFIKAEEVKPVEKTGYVGKETNYSGAGSFDPHKKCRDCDSKWGKCDETTGTHSSIPSARKGTGAMPAYAGKAGLSEEFANKCLIQNYRESFKDCIFCKMFLIVFNTASETSAIALNALQIPVINLVLMGFALWLSYTIIKYVSSLEQKDPRRMIKEILTQAAIVLFVIILLLFGSTGVFGLFMEPIFNTGMKFAMLVANASSGETGVGGKIVMTTCPIFENVSNVVGGIPASMGQSILCVIKSIQDMLMDIVSLGSTMFCLGAVEKAVIPYFFPHFGYLLTGIALYIMGVMVLIIYPWLLIDAILRMSVAVAIMPAALGGAAFKTTRKYIGKVFGTFLTSMFNFIFLTIIIFLLMELVYKTIGKELMGFIKDDASNTTPITDLLKWVGWWTVNFLKLAFILILTYAMLGDFEGLSSSFGGITGGGMSIGNIGTNVGTTAYSAATQASRIPRKMASDEIKKGMASASRNVKSGVHGLRTDMKADRIEKKGVKNADGSTTRTKKSWTGKTTTQTVTRGANGQPLVTTSVTKGNKTTTTETSKMMTKTSVVNNKTGEQISESFEMKDAALMKLTTNKKGEMDTGAVANLLQNSGHSQEDCMKGIMTQVLNERYGKDNKMIDPKGTDQKMEIGFDEKGQTTFRMTQKDRKGRTQNFNMTLGNDRIKSEVETIDKKGRSQALISDGIFNVTSNRKYNEDGSSYKSKDSFTINSYYDDAYRNPIKNGRINKKVYADTMLNDKQLRAAIHQKRKYGKLKGE